VERAVSGMGLFGWKYSGLLPFIEAMELGMLGIGFVFAVIFGEQATVYGLLAVITFVAARIVAAFFNVRALRAQLVDEMVLFIEREIGRYFASDTGGALLRLKNDLSDAIDRQAAVYKSTMDAISAKMSDTFSQVSQSMVGAANSIGPIVARAMDEKLINMNETLTETLHNWENALKTSAEIQSAINVGAEKFSQASGRIQSASDLLAAQMKGHSSAVSEQIFTLVSAIDEMKTALQTLSASQKSLATQSEFIEKNQSALENSLNSYESSLQSLTQSIGDGLGAFINLHAQTSAQTINDAMKYNIDTIKNLLGGK
jgi:FtsZ-binding cell division protein ZapB